MATRRERVVLDLEDNLTPGLARAAVASRLLKGELDNLGTTSTSTSKEVDRVGDSSSKSSKKMGDGSKEIDKLSGRLKVLRDAAILLGPAVAPLGAATIPVLTGALVGLGAAAAGVGATVAAFSGIGEGLKALDQYQLDRTPENLAKVREEFEKIGPSGERFVRYLDSIEGELKDLQNTARAGVLPGAEEGIRDLLTLLPELRSLTADVSSTVGNLLSDAGGSLAGDDFKDFFDYVRTDAAPTLDAFARTTGNFALAFGNLLVGLSPATRDATQGLLDFSERVVEASENLDDNQGFQDFLQYVREAGPEVASLLSATAGALAGVLEATAPYGAVVIPALTAVANVIEIISKSPAGPTIVATAAALTLLNRGMSTFDKVSQRPWLNSIRNAETLTGKLNAARGPAIKGGLALAGLGLAASGAADKIGLGNTATLALTGSLAGPWGAAVGGAIGLFMDMNTSAEVYKINASDLIGTLDQQTGEITENTRAWVANRLEQDGVLAAAQTLGLNLTTLTDAALGNPAAIDAVTASLAALDAALFDSDGYEINRENTTSVRDNSLLVSDAVGAMSGAIGEAKGRLPLLNEALGETAHSADAAADKISTFDSALNRLNNTLDRRQAMRDYRDAIVDFNKALKDPDTKPRELASALDGIARAGGNVAEKLSGADKLHFLSRVRAEYGDAAAKLFESDKRVQKLVDSVFKLDDASAKPRVDIDLEPLRAGIAAANAWLNGIEDETVNINVIRSQHGGGNTDPTTGGDSSRLAVYPRMFGRGSVGINASKADLFGGTLNKAGFGTSGAADAATSGLHRLRAALARAEAAVDKETRKRDALVSKMDDIRGNIRGDLSGSLFESSSDPWAAGASAMDPFGALQARKARALRFLAAIKALRKKGLAGAALQEVLGEGLEAAEFMASQSAAALGGFSAEYATTAALIGQTAEAGANAAYGAQLAEQTSQLQSAVHELREIKQAIKAAEKSNKDGHKGTQGAFASGMGFAGHAGKRRAHT